MEEPANTGDNRNPDGTFKPGVSGNPHGRPVGSISVIDKLRQIYAEDPTKFRSFVERYASNEANDRHQVEMLDGKAMQKTDITTNGESITPLLVQFLDAKDNGDTGGVPKAV